MRSSVICVLFLGLGLILSGCTNRVNLDVKGGSASNVDWRIGIPF
jgi:hypothetical protein